MATASSYTPPERVSTTARGGRLVLVGTSHLHAESATAVRAAIERHRPDSIVVELDAMRLEALAAARAGGLTPDAPRRLRGTFNPYATHNFPFIAFPGLRPLVWAMAAEGGFQSMVGALETANAAYGGDMAAAVQAAVDRGSTLVLGDRSILVTLARVSADISWHDVVDSATTLVMVKGEDPRARTWRSVWWSARCAAAVTLWRWQWLAQLWEEIVAIDIREYRALYAGEQGAAVADFNAALIDVFRGGPAAATPAQFSALVQQWSRLNEHMLRDPVGIMRFSSDIPRGLGAERDHVLAHSAWVAPGSTVVAIVGCAHLDGMERHLTEARARQVAAAAGDAAAALEVPASLRPLMQLPPWHYTQILAPPALAATALVATAWALRRRPRAASAVGVALAVGVGAVAAFATGVVVMQARLRSTLETLRSRGGGVHPRVAIEPAAAPA